MIRPCNTPCQHHHRPGASKFIFLVATSWLALAASASATEVDGVEVVGVDQVDSSDFTWVVTNHDASPIVMVQMPQAFGLIPKSPDGWTEEAMIKSYDPDAKHEPGVVRFRADARSRAIHTGRSLEFRLTMRPLEKYVGKGTVIVMLADGTTIQVPNVACPAEEPWMREYFPGVGMAGLFVVIVLFRWRAGRRKRAAADSDATQAASEGTR